ncbi:hypothetical protein ykris0001_26650 [Yersinia kristensenii ATCC 33638]|nr:hypothetical protein ykris0001_26650 [Yersinia kristensenii ATCC 33638]
MPPSYQHAHYSMVSIHYWDVFIPYVSMMIVMRGQLSP